ncbi:Nin one binding Zn-ribbon like-domain-containing protein [Powellomyces hirtus]|nr:Nin one binding Zn-ribbon like-domain-containing protein [Powellomyces hirtus]
MAPVPDAQPAATSAAAAAPLSASASSISKGRDTVHTLVVDSAPLIKGSPLAHLATHFVTIPEVLREIRDARSRAGLTTLAFELETRIPSADALAAVVAFSKKTGDFGALSAVDLKVLALTYMLEKEARGVEHLRTEPVRKGVREQKMKVEKESGKQQEGQGGEEDDEEEEVEVVADDVVEQQESSNIKEVVVEAGSEKLQPATPAEQEEEEPANQDAAATAPPGKKSRRGRRGEKNAHKRAAAEAGESANTAAAPAAPKTKPKQQQQREPISSPITPPSSTESTQQQQITSTTATTPAAPATETTTFPTATTTSPTSAEPTHTHAHDPTTINAEDDNGDNDDEDGEWITPTPRRRARRASLPDMGDEEGWITPTNIKQKKQSLTTTSQPANKVSAKKKVPEHIPVACITADFAMQNVMLQMGLRLLSVDGVAITKVKSFVMRCHACFKVTKDMEKKFCPSCGNNTLIRTSVGVDSFGNVKYYLKKNFQYNNRGTKFSIPEPKGGRNNPDLLLREDQREYMRAANFARRAKQNAMSASNFDNPDFVALDARRALGGVGSMPVIGHGRKNVNDAKKTRQKRR